MMHGEDTRSAGCKLQVTITDTPSINSNHSVDYSANPSHALCADIIAPPFLEVL